MLRFLIEAVVGLPGAMVIFVVRLYQLFVSPWLGAHCRFTPSCSAYCIQAIQKYGFLSGGARSLWRICRCHPWSLGGEDYP